MAQGTNPEQPTPRAAAAEGTLRRRLERLLADRSPQPPASPQPPTSPQSPASAPQQAEAPATRPAQRAPIQHLPTATQPAAAQRTIDRHVRALRQGHTSTPEPTSQAPLNQAPLSQPPLNQPPVFDRPDELSTPAPAGLRGRLALLRRDTGLDALPEQGPMPMAGRPAPAVYPSIRGLIGARSHRTSEGDCLLIQQRYAPTEAHGDRPLGDVLQRAAGAHTALLNAEAHLSDFDPRTALFLDIETTGLENAMGTLGFLVGAARLDGDRWLLEQWFLESPDQERAMLADIRGRIEAASSLVTFNGKRFDLPLLITRMRAHHLTLPKTPPHLDLLPASRRLIKHNLENCRLATVERDLLDVRRIGDVPGAEVPGIYRAFLHGGDPQPLVSVISHNRDDVLSMITLLDELLIRAEQPERTLMRDPRCAFALAGHAERLGRWPWAERLYRMATALPELADEGLQGLARIQAAPRSI